MLAVRMNRCNGSNMSDTGFPFSANSDARVLILGSMPSRRSLAAHMYYAHPQNGFWPIMAALFDFDAGLDYSERLSALRANGIALWDVAHQCIRPGSMDHAIKLESVVANDFESFFNNHPAIHVIFFNGRKAEELFRRLVLPGLPVSMQGIEHHLLPSTSPANAVMTRAEKTAVWKIVRDTLENG